MSLYCSKAVAIKLCYSIHYDVLNGWAHDGGGPYFSSQFKKKSNSITSQIVDLLFFM